MVLYVNGNNIIYFDSFGVEYIPKEIKKFIGNKNVITNIYIIQTYSGAARERVREVWIPAPSKSMP